MTEARSEVSLLIAFADLTRFLAICQRTDDAEIARTLDAFYEHVGSAVASAGGTLVKFIGDAALIVFTEDKVDQGVRMLLDLKHDVDRFMTSSGWDSRLHIKVNFGPVIAGSFGAAGAKRFDVIGRAVNIAATLDSTGISLSVAAFRKLSPAMRTHFKKHTPPIVYIRNEDPHRRKGK